VRKVEAPLPPGVACERTYKVLIDGTERPLPCRWFVPEAHPEGSWMCRAEITWPGGRVRQVRAGGVDAAQALILAFSSVGVELLINDHPVYWSQPNDDLGLPLIEGLAKDVAERKARYEGK
jgi:hypothetical protein